MMSPLVAALDANGDGNIDAAELAKASEALKKLDQNNDGQLSMDELRPRGPGGGPATARPPRDAGPRPQRPGAEDAGAFTSRALAKTDAEQKMLTLLAEMNEKQSRGNMTVPPEDGRILRLLAESLGAHHVVEIGTSIGYSSIWFCLGLQRAGGKLTTFEIDAGRAAQARANFKRAGVEEMITLVEGDAHEEVTQIREPIDILFLDADKEGYVDYLNKLLPQVRPGGLIVGHNINPRQADPRYIEAITTNPDLETLFLNMDRSGISLTMKKR